MEVTTPRPVHYLWLPLLTVMVLCVSLANPVCWTQHQQSELNPEFVSLAEPSVEDDPATGDTPGLKASEYLSYMTPISGERSSPVHTSDACPGIILHGPPFLDFFV